MEVDDSEPQYEGDGEEHCCFEEDSVEEDIDGKVFKDNSGSKHRTRNVKSVPISE